MDGTLVSERITLKNNQCCQRPSYQNCQSELCLARFPKRNYRSHLTSALTTHRIMLLCFVNLLLFLVNSYLLSLASCTGIPVFISSACVSHDGMFRSIPYLLNHFTFVYQDDVARGPWHPKRCQAPASAGCPGIVSLLSYLRIQKTNDEDNQDRRL